MDQDAGRVRTNADFAQRMAAQHDNVLVASVTNCLRRRLALVPHSEPLPDRRKFDDIGQEKWLRRMQYGE